ncbi:hypothetical protein BI364_13960 [Acidihalobacter yilgarnensis]|uniref:POTRA domain-containing protein n=2 Tax=Acidihalobacter yilgarnensis TaxID=2819280 RepID=A0A1D8IQZ1_9GAMM|nr:hypothetical protein BI364_13960 [Acidihalobacter yilgarnensis]
MDRSHEKIKKIEINDKKHKIYSNSKIGIKIPIKKIIIVGNKIIPSGVLRSVVDPAEGRLLSLRELESLAGKITDLYRDRGYFLSRAYVPAQTINNGIVEIDVVEVVYGGGFYQKQF